jgi:squalene synthase HpnC
MSTMEKISDYDSGKGHRDENFPVASLLIHPRHRDVILAFYRFARAADDVADHPKAVAQEKLAALNHMRATLLGKEDVAQDAKQLRRMLAERGLTNQHALDLLEAFTRDVTKTRYRDWIDLMDYCSYSAAPIGRFVLDVHGEAEATWPASDALCSALQVINHLQDCAKDFRQLDRVYVPLDAFASAGLAPDALAQPRASAGLLTVIAQLAARTASMLENAKPLAVQVHDRRLAMEIAVIQRLAESLAGILMHRDPLSERVHHGPVETAGLGISALFGLGTRRAYQGLINRFGSRGGGW